MNSNQRRVVIQALLFIATLVTTTLAGAEWTFGRSIFMPDYSWQDFQLGLPFSIPFLLFLTVHEFGHYITARAHKVGATLPYYLPMPPFTFSIGSMGAVIRLRHRVQSTKLNFDIGIAGPLAGFAMALVVLFYGFTHLPPPEYIFEIHPEYKQYGLNYGEFVYNELPQGIPDVTIGKNLLFLFFETFVADPSRVPNPHEIMHYPLLFAGYLSLMFTSLNLLPIGQLDGGHVAYGLFGFRIHRIIATVFFVVLLFYSGLGVVDPSDSPDKLLYWIPGFALFLYLALSGLGLSTRDTIMYALLIFAAQLLVTLTFPAVEGYSGWLFFSFILGRFIGVQHPPSEIEEPLDNKRIVLGWIALFIFVICFSPTPIIFK